MNYLVEIEVLDFTPYQSFFIGLTMNWFNFLMKWNQFPLLEPNVQTGTIKIHTPNKDFDSRMRTKHLQILVHEEERRKQVLLAVGVLKWLL